MSAFRFEFRHGKYVPIYPSQFAYYSVVGSKISGTSMAIGTSSSYNLCQNAKSQPYFRHVLDEARLHKELEPEDECGQTQAESGRVQSSESTDNKQKAAKKRFF